MNLYDRIKSPIENNEDLIYLINIYAKLKDAGQLNQMYRYITQGSEISEQEAQLYEDKFFNYIVEPSAKKMAQQFKDGRYRRTDDTFLHLYIEEDMQIMFNERSVEEIIRRGREIESRNRQIFKRIDPIFWKYGSKERKDLYPQFLQQNGVYLDENELRDWIDYRAVMEEFQNPYSMGFHLDRNLNDEKMKIYIDAGADTYELASMFSIMSEKQGIEPNFKVTSANVASELNRRDRLCIYIDDLKLIPKYIEILEKIKSERPDFIMRNTMPTVGSIDNWIGIGTDSIQGSSYNNDICGIITEVCNRYFENVNQTTINQFINMNPDILNNISQDMQRLCINQGKSAKKMCIGSVDEEEIKNMSGEIKKGNSTEIEKYAKNITTENITIEKMQHLYENEFTGTLDSTILNMTYQLYCENRKKDKQIQTLETKLKMQVDVKANQNPIQNQEEIDER